MSLDARGRTPPTLVLLLAVLAICFGTAGASQRALRTAGTALPRTNSLNGARFGAFVSGAGDTKWEGALNFESDLGRTMGVQRVYYHWDDPFPTAADYYARDLGRMLILSWTANRLDGPPVKWADIASGKYDGLIDTRAREIKKFGAQMYFVFHMEPYAGRKFGTAADYRHAYQHIQSRFEADGVTNELSTFVTVGTAYTNGNVNDYYPGDSWVDVVGVDAYNWYDCRQSPPEPWTSLSDKLQGFYDYGEAHGKRMVVAEWGSVEDPRQRGRKAQWITDAGNDMKQMPDIEAVSYFNSGKPSVQCDWYLWTSQSAMNAYVAMGQDPYYNPSVPPPNPTDVVAYVDVSDSGYGNVTGFPVFGKKVQWLFHGPGTHSVTDRSGMNYFDSGPAGAGTRWSFQFIAAAAYNYRDTFSPMLSRVLVPMEAQPSTGKVTTKFNLTWASEAPPAGDSFDVQIMRPGSSRWEFWKSQTTAQSKSFTPDAGKGTYSFRTRMLETPADATWWSLELFLTVSG